MSLIDPASLRDRAAAYRDELRELKRSLGPNEDWYPYDILANFQHIDGLLTGENRRLFEGMETWSVADIGAADGDLSFFLEKLGVPTIDLIDNPPTNWNGLRGATKLRDALQSKVAIHHIDLDRQFRMPRDRYSLIVLLGIFYHLKNPYYVLEELARVSAYCLLSTRVTRYASDRTTDLSEISCAYLVDAHEMNNDPTNFWIFSERGLRRIIDRCGWDIVDFRTYGNTVDSNPVTAEGDERAFCLLKSRHTLAAL